MANSLGRTNDPDSFYGQVYTLLADEYMDRVGDDTNLFVEDLVSDRGKSFATERSFAQQINDVFDFNKKGTGKSKGNARRQRQKQKKGNVKVTIQEKITHTKPTPKRKKKATREAKRSQRRLNPTRQIKYMQSTKGGSEEHLILTGCEHVAKVELGSSTINAPGQQIFSLVLNPLLQNTRLKQIAQLWQRYRFRRITMKFVASDSSFFSGTLIHYIDTDPNASYSGIIGTDALISAVSAHWNEQVMRINRSCESEYRVLPETAALWMDNASDPKKVTDQCKYFIFVQDTVLNAMGTALTYPFTLGRLYIDYEIEFFAAALPVPSAYQFPVKSNNRGDIFNGVNMLGWAANGVSAPETAKAPFYMAMKALLGGAPIDGSTVRPNFGIVSTNQVELAYDTSLGAYPSHIRFKGYGPGPIYFVMRMAWSGTGLVRGSPANPTVFANGAAGITHTAWFGDGTSNNDGICVFLQIIVSDPSLWTKFRINFNPIASASTLGLLDFTMCMFQEADYVAPPTLEGCTHRYAMEVGKRPLDEIVQAWSPKTRCTNSGCTVCPTASLIQQCRRGILPAVWDEPRFVEIADVPDSDDSEAEEGEDLTEDEKPLKKQKAVVKPLPKKEK